MSDQLTRAVQAALEAAAARLETEILGYQPETSRAGYRIAKLIRAIPVAEVLAKVGDGWQPIAAHALALKEIVEGISGAMDHGTWRDEHGMRLKDTPQWVQFYNASPPHRRRPPMTDAINTAAIKALKSRRSKAADVAGRDLSNVPDSHEVIWLQWGDNGGDDDTWCQDNINDEDVPYVRADLALALCDALDEAQSERMEQARLLGMSAERELSLRAENERLRAALQPFASSWEIALASGQTSMAHLGAIARSETPACRFMHARAALSPAEGQNEGDA